MAAGSSLNYWLAAATQDLIPVVRRRVVEDLTNHYLDAMEMYQAAGLTAEEADAAAVHELGSPEETADALHKIYPASKFYMKAALICPVFTILVLLRLLLARLFPDFVSMYTFVLILTQPMCALLTLKALVTLAPRRFQLERPLTLLCLSTAVAGGTFIVSGLYEGSLPQIMFALLGATMVLGVLGMAAGLTWFGRLLVLVEILDAVSRHWLQLLLILNAAGLAGVMILALLNDRAWIPSASMESTLLAVGMMIVISYTLLCASLTWVFVRIVRQPKTA